MTVAARSTAAAASPRGMPPAVKYGLIGGSVAVYLACVGLVQRFQSRDVIVGVIGMGRTLLLIVGVAFGYMAARPTTNGVEADAEGSFDATRGIVAGATAGAITGAVTGALVLIGTAINLQNVLISVSGALLTTLAFGQSAGVGALLLVVSGGVLGALGASARLLGPDLRKPLFAGAMALLVLSLFSSLLKQILFSLYIPTTLLYEGDGLSILGAIIVMLVTAGVVATWKRRGAGARDRVRELPDRQRKLFRLVALFLLVALLLYLPQILGIFLSEVLGTIGLFVLLGLGLNIVVGYAGLLDLGYVAFFAIGAYATGMLTSPSAAGAVEISFWAALPIVVLVSTVAGVLIGAPVLRLRGDYLAIVTLGFGEIMRLLVISNWAAPLTGGAQGILSIPDPRLGGIEFDDSQTIYYLILVACLIAAFIAVRLVDSRVGRAWNAMREDEQVAEAMGVSIIKYKLLAFAMGAAIGCLGGAFFAVKIGSIFPASFNLLVSIQVLALIILGGMGNIWGVLVGAAVLVGLPELLREFAEFRLLLYGAVLVAIMLVRPEGLVPSARRRRELHVDEPAEAQYAERAGQEGRAPVVTGRPKEAG
ncbi:MAG: branched-chain amino acid ABC transporter permease [Actinomycetota bacterium]